MAAQQHNGGSVDIKQRLEQDIKDSVQSILARIEKGNFDLHQSQYVATMLTQAASHAQQLYGMHLQDWSNK